MNRIESTVSVNGKGSVAGIVKAKPKRKRKLVKTVKAKAKTQQHSMHKYSFAKQRSYLWCNTYVAMALTLSAFLNGYANASFVKNQIAGWVLGLTIPLLVFTLFKSAGWLHEQGNMRLSVAAAIFGTVLLFLSVADCQQALSMLTHSPTPWLSWAFAITIDCGLVVCELGAMQVFMRRK